MPRNEFIGRGETSYVQTDRVGFDKKRSSLEDEKAIDPNIGRYIEANKAEPDPDGNIEKIRGVIIKPGKDPKEWEVVDVVSRDKNHGGPEEHPVYSRPRYVHKEGAVDVPLDSKGVRERSGHIKNLQDMAKDLARGKDLNKPKAT